MSLTYQQAVEQTITGAEQFHQIINGTGSSEIIVEDGSKVPSVRKALIDNFYFKDPINWSQGNSESVFNQLRKFTDGSWWYAPNATAATPISMGLTPIGDVNWVLYSLDAINKLSPQIREALRRSYAEIGYVLVSGSFESGGIVTSQTDAILKEKDGKVYYWSGTYPSGGYVVLPGTDPTLSPNWVAISGVSLRGNLSQITGSTLVNDQGKTVAERLLSIRTNVEPVSRSITEFGAKPIAGFDNAAAFAACHLYLSAIETSTTQMMPAIKFPAGIYEYSSMPNWAMDNITLIADGEVRLRFTGTSDPFTVRGATTKYNGYIGRFIIEVGPTCTTSSVITDNTAHWENDFKIQGAGVGQAGLEVGFAVCNTYRRLTVSSIEEPWYLNAKPERGMKLVGGITGNPVSFCTFEQPVIEGVNTIGIDLYYTYGNIFNGGTSEGHPVGVYIRGTSGTTQDNFNNIFNGMDTEVCPQHDFYIEGRENTIRDCTTELKITFGPGAVGNTVVGGVHQGFVHATGAVNNTIRDLVYNRYGSGAIQDDTNGKLRISSVNNRLAGRLEPSWIGVNVLSLPIVSGAIVYENTAVNPITISVSGGTVSAITYSLDGVSSDTVGVSGVFVVMPRAKLTIICTVAPRIVAFKG